MGKEHSHGEAFVMVDLLRFVHFSRVDRISIGCGVLMTACLFWVSPSSMADEARDMSGSVDEVSAKAVLPAWGVQGALQGAGTPNQAGLGGFVPLVKDDDGVWFMDAVINAHFADRSGDSSIINTEVDGISLSTSTRVGYRQLSPGHQWLMGVHAGFDSRSMKTAGGAAGRTPVISDPREVDFYQVAAGLEVVSDQWDIQTYALVPLGDTEQQLNSIYQGGALDTFGLDVGYTISSSATVSLGYYYQHGDMGAADGSGVRAMLDCEISEGLAIGIMLSNDAAYDTVLTASLQYRFNGAAGASGRTSVVTPLLQALSATPRNRDVRVHDVISDGLSRTIYLP